MDIKNWIMDIDKGYKDKSLGFLGKLVDANIFFNI